MSNENITPYYQSGVAGVEHRNLDAAGSGHPFGDEPKEWEADLRPLIRQVADDLYDSWKATVREYLANAETACLKVEDFLDNPEDSPYDDMIVSEGYQPKIEVTWDKSEQKLIIKDNGIGMAGIEVDQVFRHIGRSAARDLGTMSGSFGMGALSFFKFIGAESSMVMVSHSRLNGDNASYLISLAGVEPVMGTFDADTFGTQFTLTQKEKDMAVREAIDKFAQWMRVPVLYRELDENKEELDNDDLGDKRLYDNYDDPSYMTDFSIDGCFEAYMSEDATGKTLLLSMEIDRGDSGKYGAMYPFDVRLLDESGKVCRSSNGNEGLIPISRFEYEQMLAQERPNHIVERLLKDDDVVGHTYEHDDIDYVINGHLLESDTPLPVANYLKPHEAEDDMMGEKIVIIGPNQGRRVVSEDAWQDLPEGRAEMYVPEDELEPYDLDDDTGDLTLPKPTTHRSSLQSHETFWKYIGREFERQHDEMVESYRGELHEARDQLDALQNMEDKSVKTYKNENRNR